MLDPSALTARTKEGIPPGDLESADNALSEANVLDPEDPQAWGLLALVALRQGRQVG